MLYYALYGQCNVDAPPNDRVQVFQYKRMHRIQHIAVQSQSTNVASGMGHSLKSLVTLNMVLS